MSRGRRAAPSFFCGRPLKKKMLHVKKIVQDVKVKSRGDRMGLVEREGKMNKKHIEKM